MGLYVYIHKYEFLLFLILFILVCFFLRNVAINNESDIGERTQ